MRFSISDLRYGYAARSVLDVSLGAVADDVTVGELLDVLLPGASAATSFASGCPGRPRRRPCPAGAYLVEAGGLAQVQTAFLPDGAQLPGVLAMNAN